MTVNILGKRLKKLKRIRSLDEVITRGGQALSIYKEQRRGTTDIPTDEEFVRLIDASQFGKAPIIAESLWQKFYKNGAKRFFSAFRDPEASAAKYKETFGDGAADRFIEAAEKIVAGKIDLLGYKDLTIGIDVDWHREPLSGKRSPLKHWNEFDGLDIGETGDKKIIWELNRHQHFFTLGLAFCLTGDEQFARVFVDHLESWMDQNPPGIGINWASSLEISFRAMSWIWAFQLFRDSDLFTPELLKRALKYLYAQACHIEKYLSTYYSPNTHLTGEALGLYYLGTQLPFFERANDWKKVGKQILVSEIGKQIMPDGVHFEQSTWYQRYTVDFYCQFILLSSLSDDPPTDTILVEDHLGRAFDFLMHVTLPDGRTPLVGDDDGGRLLPLTHDASDDFRGSLSLGAAILKRPDLKYVGGSAAEEIFWLMGADGLAKYETLKASKPQESSNNFPSGGYSVMRDGWDETDNHMIVDCGQVGSLSGGHGHADALSIELAVHGKTLLVDPGTYSYHESHQMRDHFRSSASHNTLTIDGRSSSEPGGTFNWETRAECAQKKWISEERFDFFKGSHNGYERLPHPATHTRSIMFLKGDYWIMRDLVETTGEHDYSLNFHYDPEIQPEISQDGPWLGDNIHRIWTFGDYGSWHKTESCVSTNYGSRVNASLMRFRSRGYGNQEFFTFILPVTACNAPPEVSEVGIQSGRSFVIKYRGYTDFFVFNDDVTHGIETEMFTSNFEWTWTRTSTDKNLPDEYVLIDGTGLTLGVHEIFAETKVPYATARRLGNELYIKTDRSRRNVSIAPAEKRRSDRRNTSPDGRLSST
jgi:hypothetical protein